MSHQSKQHKSSENNKILKVQYLLILKIWVIKGEIQFQEVME